MFALYYLLPLLASVTWAAPTQHQANIEPRQRRPGGNRGSRVRPGATQPAPAAAPAPAPTSAVVAPVASASTSSSVASASADAPVASSSADTASETSAPAVSSASGSASVDPSAPAATGTGTGVAASASTPAASATGSSSASGTGGDAAGSGPVGLGWNPAKNKASMSSYVDAGLQWYTNWSPKAGDAPTVEFVPMVWGTGSVPELKAAMASWPTSTKHVLSFNEPDMVTNGGSAISVADGVKSHNEAVTILGDGYEIGSPAVANHPEGEKWLDDWLSSCEAAGGCKHDFVPFHFYGRDAAEVIAYAKKFSTKYKKSLWLTEWACHDFGTKEVCTPAEAEKFMKTIIEWFRGEGASMVTRWAWFGAFPDMTNWNGNNMDGNRIANADGTINALGKEYMKL